MAYIVRGHVGPMEKHMNTFEDLARDYTDDGIFRDVDTELVGTWLFEEYGDPHEYEPLVEGLTPEHARAFSTAMIDGPKAQATWMYEAVRMVAECYTAATQEAMEKANEPPFWHDDRGNEP